MNIRKATTKDSLLLSTLCMDVQQLHAKSHPDLFKTPQSPDFAVPFFDKMLLEDTIYIYIAEENHQALGYIFYKIVDRNENPFLFARRYLLIDQISVRPQNQGQGAGRALMLQVEITARELGIPSIQLGTWDFNTKAHGFFERMGYRPQMYDFWKVIE